MSGRAGPFREASRAGGWRALGVFWGALCVAGLALAAVLEVLGPPRLLATAAPSPPAPAGVAPPQTALLEADPADPAHFLPRVAADGRAPRVVYAAPAPVVPAGMARVGLIVAGFGLDHPQSRAALAALPAAVTLAVSPYTPDPGKLLAAARAHGHEYLLSLPMQPDAGPLDDAGDHALLVAAPEQQNLARLDWALSRLEGYVGATDLLVGRLQGRQFIQDAAASAPVLDVLGRRGLDYLGAELGGAKRPGLWARGIDMLVDQKEDAASIDARLADLARLARRDGTAIGAAGAVRPVTVARIEAWAKGLAAQHVVLVPVSALVPKPSR